MKWNESATYLKVDISPCVCKFYASVNARLCLFESVSLPILTYGCESMCLFGGDIKKLNVCWNNVFRKIFGMNVWESVK